MKYIDLHKCSWGLEWNAEFSHYAGQPFLERKSSQMGVRKE